MEHRALAVMPDCDQSDNDAAEGRPHYRVVEHATYAQCLDCYRHVGSHAGCGNINYHALNGRVRRPLQRKKRAKLEPGFAAAAGSSAASAAEQPRRLN
eukprot:1096284-Amphidinium_carterae.1